MFPAELPKRLPERSGIDSQHHIDLEPNSKVPKRRMYRVSPAE